MQEDAGFPEASYFHHIIPPPLRLAFQNNVGLIQQLVQSAVEQGDDLDSHTGSMDELVSQTGKQLIAAMQPLAQQEMEHMSTRDRVEIMAWLSDPEPIADAMRHLLNEVFHNADFAQNVIQSAVEMAQQVQGFGEAVNSPEELLNEINTLREAVAAGEQGPSAAALERMQVHARQVAEEAAATSHTAQLPSLASASSPAAPRARRSSGRLALRRHSDPLEVLADDTLLLVLLRLDADDLVRLQNASTAWKGHVRAVVRSDEWRTAYGCIRPNRDLCQVLCESGVAQIDVGHEGRQTGLCPAPTVVDQYNVFTLQRCDGPSVGPVSTRHVFSLLCKIKPPQNQGMTISHALNIAHAPFKPQVVTKETDCTRLRIVHGEAITHSLAMSLNAMAGKHSHDAPPPTPEVLCYGEEIQLVSRDGAHRLNCNMGVNSYADSYMTRRYLAMEQANLEVKPWSTRFQIKLLEESTAADAGANEQTSSSAGPP